MAKNLILGIVVLAVIFLGYMMFFNKEKSSPTSNAPKVTASPSASTSAIPSASASEVLINLAEENESSESGTATLTEANGKVKVTLKLVGAPKDVAQPAHIHVGACPEVGAVKYPLNSPVNGMSETVLDTTFAKLKTELPLGINVHKSATESKVYVSCGDLKF